MAFAHANSPHVYVLPTCTHIHVISRCGAAQSSGWPAWARLRQSGLWPGNSQPLCQLLVPAGPLLCPAWGGHRGRESPRRPQRIPLLCPHGLLPLSHRLAAPRGHAGPLGAGQPGAPGPGAVSALRVALQRVALSCRESTCSALGFEGLLQSLCPGGDWWHHREGGCTHRERGSGKGWYQDQEVLSPPALRYSWERCSCDRNGCKTQGTALPLSPASRGRSQHRAAVLENTTFTRSIFQ